MAKHHNLRPGDEISVRGVWHGGRNVFPARVGKHYGRRRVVYNIRGAGAVAARQGRVNTNDEGMTWCRGWDGEAVRALQAVAALDGEGERIEYPTMTYSMRVSVPVVVAPWVSSSSTVLIPNPQSMTASNTGVRNIASTAAPTSPSQRDTPSTG